MPMNQPTPSSAPYPETPSDQVSYGTKKDEVVCPFEGDVVYVQEGEASREAAAQRREPTHRMRVATLVLISVALTLTVVTTVLLAICLAMGWGSGQSDSYGIFQGIMAMLTIMGLTECGFSIITLIVCVVMTAVAPRRVMANPTTHAMNCLCATIFLLTMFSVLPIAAFGMGTTADQNSNFSRGSIVAAVLATLSKLAYFIMLLIAKGSCGSC